MTKRIAIDYIADICDALRKCIQFTEGMEYDQFIRDDKTLFAVIRALEVVGEAAKRVLEEWRADYHHIPWKEMAGMRDVLIHQYFGINYSVLWKTIHKDIKELLPLFEEMLQAAKDT